MRQRMRPEAGMIYLSEFTFPSYDEEYAFRLNRLKRTCYNTMYPFFVLSAHGLERLDFAPVTIFYGGNGSGKTTALNVIAERLRVARGAPFNKSSFFGDYVGLCTHRLASPLSAQSAVITSDDVFDFMLDLRGINEGIDRRREELLEEYLQNKYAHFRMTSLDDYDRLKEVCSARSRTQSKYVKDRLSGNVREQSNGESAFLYFTQRMEEPALYLLDEPENSLSPARQMELREFLEQSAHYFDCQLVIATHSPFLLSIGGAKIYDFDADPVDVKRWTQLENVRAYYDFFKRHRKSFEP